MFQENSKLVEELLKLHQKIKKDVKFLMSQKDERRFNGSEKNNTVFRSMNVIWSSPTKIVQGIRHQIPEELLTKCYEIVRAYATKSIDLKKQNKIAEIDHVQPRSFVLLQKLSELVLPQHFPDIHFYCKHSDSGEENGQIQTKYETIISDNDDTVQIYGESDAVVHYSNTCIFVWEDKDLDKSLTTPNEKG